MSSPQRPPARTLGLLLGSGSWGVFWGGWAALLPGMKEQAAVSATELGLALLAIPVGALPAMLVMGPLYDRHGRGAFGVTLAGFAVTSVLPGFASGSASLATSLLLVGAASGAIEVGLNAATATAEATSGRRLFHTVHATTPIAMIIAAPAVGLARGGGVAPVWILLGIAGVVAASAIPNMKGVGPPPALASGAGAESGSPLRRLVLSRGTLWCGMLGAAVLFMENAVEQWSAVLLESELGASAFVASLGPAVYMAALALGRIAVQRFGGGLTAPRAVMLAGVSGTAGVGLAAAAQHPLAALGGFGVAGLGIAAALPSLLAAAGRDASPGRRGAAVSTVTTVSYLGFLASPASVGAAAGVWGLSGAFGTVAVLGLAIAAAGFSDPSARPQRRMMST